MRIQHNIMAMNAYRNYNTNTSALSKNLEKLSSGYKINRAGDDAAGLAISEKMRAQITGLEAAQKNVKDGISLVKTAEGAMQEIQDMLNRMDYLATQSANGTYDNEVDRAALQKEVDQLKSEIDRIADSANFNGIKLLDGSLDADGVATTVSGTDRIISTVAGASDGVAQVGTKTFLDGSEATEATKTVFEMDFSDLKAVEGASAGTSASLKVAVDFKDDNNTSGGVDPSAVYAANDTVTFAGTGLNLTFKYDGNDWALDGTTAPTGYSASFDGTNLSMTKDDVGTVNTTSPFGTITVTASIAGAAGADNLAVNGNTPTWTDGTDAGASAGGGNITVDVKLNNIAIGNGSVAVTADDDAEAIAKAVFEDLGTPTSNKIENLDLFGDGTLYTAELDGTKIKFTLEDEPTANNIKGNFDWDITITDGQFEGSHTAGTNVVTPGSVKSAGVRANTVFEVKADDIKDGTTITLDGKTVTLSVGPNSTVKDGDGVVKLTATEAADINLALGKISEAFGGETDNFEVSVNNGGNGDAKVGLAIYKKADSKETYVTKDQLAGVFSMSVAANDADKGTALTLQIGDTSDDYNQLKVSIGDMHTAAMGIANLNIGTQDGAAAAIETIRNAINYVSGIRGDLGATQNRLEHTQNNLSVMAENIQDAESTIRDTDVAEEMMSYVKNNILVQSAQAMLAQANQVPQGVLQLLG